MFGISVFLESHKNHCYVTFRYVALRVTLRFEFGVLMFGIPLSFLKSDVYSFTVF